MGRGQHESTKRHSSDSETPWFTQTQYTAFHNRPDKHQKCDKLPRKVRVSEFSPVVLDRDCEFRNEIPGTRQSFTILAGVLPRIPPNRVNPSW